MTARPGLFLRRETERGVALSWYGEPFGRIYRSPADPERWLGEVWDGRARQTVWQPLPRIDAAVAALQKWAEATRVDLLAARYETPGV